MYEDLSEKYTCYDPCGDFLLTETPRTVYEDIQQTEWHECHFRNMIWRDSSKAFVTCRQTPLQGKEWTLFLIPSGIQKSIPP